MQKPHGAQMPPNLLVDTGAQWPFQVVRVLPSRVEWTESRFATSDAPGDAHIWYRSVVACNGGARRYLHSAFK